MRAPLPPLAMSRFVDKVQGADVADGAVWLSTSDDTNELFRVDLETGQVDDLGSAGEHHQHDRHHPRVL